MYEKYFGLTNNPFDLSPNPTVVYGSETHQEGLATLRYGVLDRKGFLLLTGGVGSGKTTLLQVLCGSIDHKIHVCMIANPKINRDEFYYYLSEKLNLGEYDGNKAKFILAFTNFLEVCANRDDRVILIIDEAHVIPIDILEEIRLLSNQEYKTCGVMSIFLVGQPELLDRLKDERLLPLRQRISTKFHLEHFSEEDTKRYIIFRLKKAGTSINCFTDKAIQAIHAYTNGTPRLINVICDRAMLMGFAESNKTIDESIIQKSIQELHLPGEEDAYAKPVKGSYLRGNKKMAYLNVQIILLVLLLILAGKLYSIYSQPDWPGHKTMGNIYDLVITKGRIVWEQYLRP